MSLIFKAFRTNKLTFLGQNVAFVSTNTYLNQISRPVLRRKISATERIGPYGWFMLILPSTAFGLGIWQIQRKAWKENLIADIEQQTKSAPVELPENLDDLRYLEYHPVHVKGTFLHDKEIYLGPRSLIQEESTEPKGLFSNMLSSNQGYYVITPLKLADRNETILVNRGWVNVNRMNPSRRREGQVEGVVDVVGLLRLNESRPNFSIKNTQGTNLYMYRDLQSMCAATGAIPVFLDQTLDYNVPGGPIGGQTRVTLRNEHLSYIITWFSLGIATLYMWAKKFVIK